MGKPWTDPMGSVAGCTKVMVLASSLVGTALLMGLALTSPAYSSLAWISLLPLFWAIRFRGPTTAAFCGALWGLSLYFFCTLGAAPAIAPALFSLVLLATVPALYAGLGSLLTRAIGFNPLMLACGWILLELALKPAGLHHGLLAAAVLAGDPLVGGPLAGGPLTEGLSEGGAAHWLARLLGYVLLASLLAGVNASLLGIVSGARLSFPIYRSLEGSPNAGACLPSQGVLAIQTWTLRQGYPRAPPIPAAAVN